MYKKREESRKAIQIKQFGKIVIIKLSLSVDRPRATSQTHSSVSFLLHFVVLHECECCSRGNRMIHLLIEF